MAITLAFADEWVRRFGQAWERTDPEVAELFTDDCEYAERPLVPPRRGRAAVAQLFRELARAQRNIRFSHKVLAVKGNTVVAHWTTSYERTVNGAQVQLDGIFVLEFDDHRICRSLREWWHRDERPPFD